MATLTWRDVAAPDFRTSLEGYKTFSNMLDNAFGTIEKGLGAFEQKQTSSANNEIMLAALKQRDPAAMKAALESGSLVAGIDPRKINPETLNFLNNQAGTLLSQATAEDNLKNQRYNTGRVQDTNSRMDAARTATNAYLAAAAAGDENKAQQILAANPEIGQMDTAQLKDLLSGGQNLVKGDVDITGGRLGNQGKVIDNEQGRFNLDTAKRDDADRQQAQQIIAEVGLGAMDADSARATVSGLAGKVSPGALAMVMGQVNSMFPGTFGASEIPSADGGLSAGGASAPTGDPTRVMNYEARAAGFNSVPANVKTLGQASDFAIQVNRAGAPSSAMGTYQIVGQTLRGYAPKVLGPNWRNEEFSPQNQDKIAEAIFNDNRGSAGALKKQWVSLSTAEAEAVRKMPWNQAREVIARKESGGSPAKILADTNVAGQLIANRAGQNNINSIIPGYEKAMQDGSTIAEVSGRIAPLVPGMSRGTVEKKIDEIYRKSFVNGQPTINYATAGEIVKRAVRNNDVDDSSIFRIRRAGDKPASNRVSIDERAITADIQAAKRVVDKSISDGQVVGTLSSIQSAQRDLATKQQKLNALLQRAETQPGLVNQIPRLQADVARAAARAEALIGQVANDRTVMPIGRARDRTPRLAKPSNALNFMLGAALGN